MRGALFGPPVLMGAEMRISAYPWIFRHLAFPVTLLILAIWMLMAGHGDQWFADQIYRWQGGQWAHQDNWWLQDILHKGGRRFSQCAGVVVLAALVMACCNPRWRHWRKPLLYLFLAAGLSTGLVSLLKHLTQMDCPWDLQRYGGLQPLIGLFEPRPAALGRAACFPSGHASAGYAWVALYFFALHLRPAWRWRALGAALAAGLIFGLVQQWRGAHFLSHDLATLAISWSVAVLLYAWMLRGREGRA